MLYFFFAFFKKNVGVTHPRRMCTPTFILEPKFWNMVNKKAMADSRNENVCYND